MIQFYIYMYILFHYRLLQDFEYSYLCHTVVLIVYLFYMMLSWNSNALATWCEELTHLKRPDAGKDWGQEEKGMTEDEMVRWHHRLNGHGFGWTPGVRDGQGVLQFTGSQRVGHDWATELNWTELKCVSANAKLLIYPAPFIPFGTVSVFLF